MGAAWRGAGVELPSCLPSFAREQGDVDKLVAKFDAAWLLQE